MNRSWRGAALATMLLLSSPLPAYAESRAAANAKQGRKLFSEGRMQFDLGHFERAIELFEEAHRLKPDPVYLFNIGQSHRLLGNTSRALFFYRSYLRNKPDASNRVAVEAMILQCEKELEEEKQQRLREPQPRARETQPEPPTPPAAVTTAPPSVPADDRENEAQALEPSAEDGKDLATQYELEAAVGTALWLVGTPEGSSPGYLGSLAFGVMPSWARSQRLGFKIAARASVWSAPEASGRLLFIPLTLEPSLRVGLGDSQFAFVLACGFGINVIPQLDEDSTLLEPKATRVVGTLSALEVRPSAALFYDLSATMAIGLTVAYAYDGKLDRWFRTRSLQRVETLAGVLVRL